MEIPAGSQAVGRYALIFLPPLSAVLMGLARWKSRARRRDERVARYGPRAAAPPSPPAEAPAA